MAGTLVLTDTMNSTFDSSLSMLLGHGRLRAWRVRVDNSTAPSPRIDQTVVDQGRQRQRR